MEKNEEFQYKNERFADIQMLRYDLPGFEDLTLRQKKYIYHLSRVTLWGRDITFDQNGKYNLLIRKVLEDILTSGVLDTVASTSESAKQQAEALKVYLKRVWFSNGIYHHYTYDKFQPEFTKEFFIEMMERAKVTIDIPLEELLSVMFDKNVLPKRVNKTEGEDLVKTSACNFYDGVTQQEAEEFYKAKKANSEEKHLPPYGLNSTLVKRDGEIKEVVWRFEGKYTEPIYQIIKILCAARENVENEQQKEVIDALQLFYASGDVRNFDEYSIEWLKETEGRIDFVNGFIEVYGDPLGLKATWEGIVEYKNLEASARTQAISKRALWFEKHSPIDDRFKKKTVKGIVANVVYGAMLGGEEYPSTAIGINLPNADWIRAKYGSKSVTISNFTNAYNKVAQGNGFLEEFINDQSIIDLVKDYGNQCDDLHTDLHECLGHGSGKLLPDTDPDALKAYGSTIEEARADLFGLYYIADKKMLKLGLLDNENAYKAHYYTYMLNGLLTQSVRIKLGKDLEEAHMRNRALIANWCYEHSNGAVVLRKIEGKTYLEINDYQKLRSLFAELLAEVQRIKSEGDYNAAKELVEKYGVKIDRNLHEEILNRYEKLDIAPYKGFLNPHMIPVYDDNHQIIDIQLDFSETYTEQMLRYSRDYSKKMKL